MRSCPHIDGFEKTIDLICGTMASLPDNRTGSNTQYSMQDAGLEIAHAGRARWKVENENNNTLKTKGDLVLAFTAPRHF